MEGGLRFRGRWGGRRCGAGLGGQVGTELLHQGVSARSWISPGRFDAKNLSLQSTIVTPRENVPMPDCGVGGQVSGVLLPVTESIAIGCCIRALH
jgi:hypothetical protein